MITNACLLYCFNCLKVTRLNLVKKYDGEYPERFIELYLDFYEMSREEFDSVLDTHANKDLFYKEDGRWKPKFTPK